MRENNETKIKTNLDCIQTVIHSADDFKRIDVSIKYKLDFQMS